MINRLSSSFGLAFYWDGEDYILLSPGLFWHPLFRWNSSFKLVFALNDTGYPVSLRTSWASFGRLLLERISYLTRGRTVRWSWRSGEVGGWFGATTGRASTLVAVVSVACTGSLLLVRAFCAPFLFTSLGSGHCPVAGRGVGVRPVVL